MSRVDWKNLRLPSLTVSAKTDNNNQLKAANLIQSAKDETKHQYVTDQVNKTVMYAISPITWTLDKVAKTIEPYINLQDKIVEDVTGVPAMDAYAMLSVAYPPGAIEIAWKNAVPTLKALSRIGVNTTRAKNVLAKKTVTLPLKEQVQNFDRRLDLLEMLSKKKASQLYEKFYNPNGTLTDYAKSNIKEMQSIYPEIDDYVSAGAYEVNRYLRNIGTAKADKDFIRRIDVLLNSNPDKYVKSIDLALDNVSDSFNGIVFRGLNNDATALINKLKESKILKDPGYMSTSHSFLKNADYPYRLILKTKSGKFIEPYSILGAEEREVLIPRNTTFNLIKNFSHNNREYFILREQLKNLWE